MDESFHSLRLAISKTYGEKAVVDDLKLDIAGGEFVTLLGPSGCGKSTALSIVAGLVPATDGGIWLDDERIDHLPPEKRGFGMVFQNYALFPHMTVFGNVAFGLDLQRRPKDEIGQRVAKMLAMVQLSGFEERFPGQLSGGQQQRVAIARALVLHPRLMLFDEPLSNLDAKLRVEMRAEIKQLHTELGLTSIYVTHDQAEALSMSDRIAVLREGILMQVGTPEEIHDHPANAFVADFMGFRNFIKVKLSARPDGGMEAVGVGLRLPVDANPAFAPGADATLAIRPENIRVSSAGDALPGVVEIAEYLGREQEVAVRINDQSRLWVRTVHKLNVGDRVALSLPADLIVLLPPG
jgi:putative spermidine/putrescine transport system ATP-binding protein